MTSEKPKPIIDNDNGFWKTKLTKILDDNSITGKQKVVCYIVSKVLDTTLYLLGIWMWLNV